jgi:UDP-N-acetyl-D-glucosamine dehydrogenase
MKLLQERGAIVSYSDPHVPTFPKMRRHRFELRSVQLTRRTIASYDCVVIATNHDAFDYEMIRRSAKLIVDTRGVYVESKGVVVKA